MATMVGTQRNLVKLLNSLIELDLDAVAAYRAAIERLENTADKNQMGAFMEDHERHITELTQVVESWGEDAAENVDLKAVLTQGKVVIGALFGDRAILMAMKTNEDDTNTAYDRACARADLPEDVRRILVRNRDDEHRHRAYIEQRLGREETGASTYRR